MNNINNAILTAILSSQGLTNERPSFPALSGDADEILGALLDDDDEDGYLGDDDEEDELDDLLSGDPNMLAGEAEILGAARRIMRRRGRRPARKNTGRRVVAARPSEQELKWELLPIPDTTLTAGQTLSVNVTPTRAQRLDQIEFPSSNVDHPHIALLSIEIAGVQQLNGSGGVRLSQLSEMRSHNILRGSTAQRNEPLILTFANKDTTNSRTLFGTIGGPTIR